MKDLTTVIKEISGNPQYIDGRNQFYRTFSNYHFKSGDEKQFAWNWFHKYVNDNIWSRKMVYALLSEGVQDNNDFQEELLLEISECLSGIVAEGAPSVLASDPVPPYELLDYVRSRVWLD